MNESEFPRVSRRQFVQVAAVAAAALSTGLPALAADVRPRRNIKLGLDNFSVRAMAWKAPQLIEYAVSFAVHHRFRCVGKL
jgi:hypothetical protein